MKKGILITLLVLVVLGGGLAAFGYFKLFKTATKTEATLFVPTGTDYEGLKSQLLDEGVVGDEDAFDFAAQALQYGSKVTPGKYHIKSGISMLNLVRMLRRGSVEAVRVTFHNVRTLEAVAGKVAPYIEADSIELLNALKKGDYWSQEQVQEDKFCCLVPNTYEFFWSTSGEQFVKRMVEESKRFWNDERKAKAEALGLSPCEVVNLAAIVQEEQSAILSEQARIAGLYLNRLTRGIPLQADPTLKYVANDFSITRVLNYHKELESPYNTYKYGGLPPSPIVIPEINAIEAVLNAENHDYIYMCAKEDFSGYHNFAKSLRQHNINAARYHRAMNRRR